MAARPVTFFMHKHVVPEEVKVILRKATVIGQAVKLPPGQLDRKLYEQVDKTLRLLGGKWNRASATHLFEGPCEEAFQELLSAGKVEVLDKKKTYQFFPTPAIVAHQMAETLRMDGKRSTDEMSTLRFLEPSAGTGVLCKALEAHGAKRVNISICEVQDDLRNPLANEGYAMRGIDFLSCKQKIKEYYDGIIMNPPFRAGQDVDHVRHAYKFLRPGCRMVALTSPSWEHTFSQRNQEFKNWFWELEAQKKARKEELPEGTFAESGTNIRTLLLTIDKP